MADDLHEWARRIGAMPPPPTRLEVGGIALIVLRATVAPAEYPPLGCTPLSILTGIPIVANTELDPFAWQLLNAEGEVIKSGAVRYDPAPAQTTATPEQSGYIARGDR